MSAAQYHRKSLPSCRSLMGGYTMHFLPTIDELQCFLADDRSDGWKIRDGGGWCEGLMF